VTRTRVKSWFANSRKRQEMTDHQHQTPTRKSTAGVGRLRRAVATGFVTVAVTVAVLGALAASASAVVSLGVSASHSGSVQRGDEYVTYSVAVTNTGDSATTSATNVNFALAPGMQLDGVILVGGVANGWTCLVTALTCTYANSPTIPAGGNFPVLTVGVLINPDVVPDAVTATFTAFGGGAGSAGIAQDSLTVGAPLEFGLVENSFMAGACSEAPVLTPPTTGACESGGLGDPFTQAGGHPFAGNATFSFKTKRTRPNVERPDISWLPFKNARDIVVSLPPGFVANPTVIAGGCTIQQIQVSVCPARYAVGRTWAQLNPGFAGTDQLSTVFKVQAEKGYPASFAFRPVTLSPVVVVLRPKVRPGDFTVAAFSPNPPQIPALETIKYFTFCSYGAESINKDGFSNSRGCKQPDDPGALSVPFLTNPTRCTGEPDVTSLDTSSYQDPGAFDADGFPDLSDSDWKRHQATAPPLTGCENVPFDPSVTVAPTTAAPDSASGLAFDLDVPQDGLVDPEGIATSHLDKTVVELPEGLSVNPSAATGLQGCTDDQMGLVTRTAPGPFPVQFNGQPVTCPDESKLGTVEVTSPLIDETVQGVMYLGTPKSTDPESGQMLRLFLALRNDDIGLMAKLEGSTTADPQTGRLTATFDNNPQLPFDHLKVRLKPGARASLATPPDCGTKTTETELEPWSGTGAVDRPSSFDVTGDCAERFSPDLAAGNSNNQGRGQGGAYSFKFSRQDGEQWLQALTATLPKGLLASVREVPLCSNAAADAGSCPAESKIGVVDAKAGAGDPFVLEQKGEMFLTDGYKGGEYGLAVKVRPIAGPFRGDMELSPIIVRQAIHVDRTTAQVTAISDPFPIIHHGVPLRVREVNVLVNRDGFMLNPSDCAAKQTGAKLTSTENTVADVADPFQVSGCSSLAFKPKLTLSLTGRRQTTTGKHPGIRAQVTQAGTAEAGIEKAVVRLPKSLALDVNNAQALCEFVDGTKPDLENHCPKGSIVGRARAKTPLLKNDLAGNVYFVKNVRKDPTTGNLIRTLPMIVVALRGEISINLRGESDTTRAGKLVNTFNNVPDAPVSQFNLNIKGGNTGIIAVTRTRRSLINICAGRHTAEADMNGHNGRQHDRDIRMKTPCTKKQTKAAKRQAKRAAAKARKAKRG
jgi:hypothetical protein